MDGRRGKSDGGAEARGRASSSDMRAHPRHSHSHSQSHCPSHSQSHSHSHAPDKGSEAAAVEGLGSAPFPVRFLDIPDQEAAQEPLGSFLSPAGITGEDGARLHVDPTSCNLVSSPCDVDPAMAGGPMGQQQDGARSILACCNKGRSTSLRVGNTVRFLFMEVEEYPPPSPGPLLDGPGIGAPLARRRGTSLRFGNTVRLSFLDEENETPSLDGHEIGTPLAYHRENAEGAMPLPLRLPHGQQSQGPSIMEAGNCRESESDNLSLLFRRLELLGSECGSPRKGPRLVGFASTDNLDDEEDESEEGTGSGRSLASAASASAARKDARRERLGSECGSPRKGPRIDGFALTERLNLEPDEEVHSGPSLAASRKERLGSECGSPRARPVVTFLEPFSPMKPSIRGAWETDQGGQRCAEVFALREEVLGSKCGTPRQPRCDAGHTTGLPGRGLQESFTTEEGELISGWDMALLTRKASVTMPPHFTPRRILKSPSSSSEQCHPYPSAAPAPSEAGHNPSTGGTKSGGGATRSLGRHVSCSSVVESPGACGSPLAYQEPLLGTRRGAPLRFGTPERASSPYSPSLSLSPTPSGSPAVYRGFSAKRSAFVAGLGESDASFLRHSPLKGRSSGLGLV